MSKSKDYKITRFNSGRILNAFGRKMGWSNVDGIQFLWVAPDGKLILLAKQWAKTVTGLDFDLL